VRRAAEIGALLALALILLAGCRGKGPAPFAADHPSARATLAADSAGLGDPVRLRIEAIVPKGARVALDAAGDSVGGWKVLRAEPPAQNGQGRWDHWERYLTIAAYRLGDVGPDTLRLRGVTARGESLKLAYAPPRLRVGGTLKPGEPTDPTKARDIRDVLSTGVPIWPWIVAGALLVAAAAIFAIRFLRARRRARRPGPVKPAGPTPEEEFEAAIASLLAEGLLERGLCREFYYGVSRAVRLYLERLSGLPLLESTSGEVMSLLEPGLRDELERIALRDWLSEGDLVKYARMERLQAEAQRYLLRSRDLVRILARKPEPPPAMSVPATTAQPAAEAPEP